jgi:hypothetical protein
LTAYVQGTTTIDRRIIRQAAAELQGGTIAGLRDTTPRARARPRMLGGGAAAGAIVVLGGALWLGHLQLPSLDAPIKALMAIGDAARPARTGDAGLGTSNAPSDAAPVAKDVPPAPVPPAPEIEKTSTPLTLVSEGDVRLRALLWEFTRTSRQGGEREKPTLASVAGSFGLDVLSLWLDLSQLKQFRVSSIVETYSPEAPEPMLFIPRASSADELELIDAPGNIRRLTDAAFARIWFGRVYLFSRTGMLPKAVLSSGKRGAEVQVLQQQLRTLSYLATEPTGVFDGETLEAVRRFQREHHLQVDGAVGPNTKVLLYHLSGRTLQEAAY